MGIFNKNNGADQQPVSPTSQSDVKAVNIDSYSSFPISGQSSTEIDNQFSNSEPSFNDDIAVGLNKPKKSSGGSSAKKILIILLLIFIVLGAAGYFLLFTDDDNYISSADDLPAPNFNIEQVEPTVKVKGSTLPLPPIRKSPPAKDAVPELEIPDIAIPDINKDKIKNPSINKNPQPSNVSYAGEYEVNRFADLGDFAVAQSSFWDSESGKAPHMWLKVKTQKSTSTKKMKRNSANILIKYVLNNDGYNVYNKDSQFEKKFFNQLDFVDDNVKDTATAIKDIYLHMGVKSEDIRGISGIITVNNPNNIQNIALDAKEGSSKTINNFSFEIVSIIDDQINLKYLGDENLLLDIAGYNKQDQKLQQNKKEWVKNSERNFLYTLSYHGIVDKLKISIAQAIEKKEYPFVIGEKYNKKKYQY